MRVRGTPLWWWCIPLVLFVSAPWAGVTSPQWDRLYLVPFSDPHDKPRDLILNVVLLLPFGYSFLKHSRGSHRLFLTVLAAAALSVVAEASQVFGVLRNPSATDVCAAVAGGLAGALWRLRHEKSPD